MRAATAIRWRRGATIAAIATLAAAVGVLVVDRFRWAAHYPAAREDLRLAEEAARDDADAAPALQALVERRTAESLRFERRQRAAGVVALVAAGLSVALLSRRGPRDPALPATLAKRLRKRAAPSPSTNSEAAHRAPPMAVAPAPPVDQSRVAAIVGRVGREPRHLIPLLHAIDEEFHYVPPAALQELSRLTDATPTQVAGVVSFYSRFRTRPRGRHVVQVCRGTACHVAGVDRVLEELRRHLGIAESEDTDPALRATVETVGCLGCCTLAPVLRVDDEFEDGVRVEDLPEIIESRLAADGKAHRRRRVPRTAPSANGAARPRRGALGFDGASSGGRLAGLWRRDPPVADGVRTPSAELLNHDEQAILGGAPVVRVVTEHCGVMDPRSQSDYRRHGGFAALEAVLRKGDPAGVIETIDRSGLRGRGGGGFPTARKWRLVNAADGEKFIVANGDEGDPGAFMDRVIMESCPYRVLEGMAIAAYAVGARRGFLYVRNEYPLAVARVRHAVSEMTRSGLLGESVLELGFAFDVEVVEGGGAFVCGEETALLESIMGRRGTPRSRPPYPVEQGLWGRPTLVNNVETLASVPWILRNGAERFAAMGTAGSKGAKVFALAGKVRRGGLVEAPMGVTIRQLVEGVGGGVPEGRTFKAVQIGGPSGGCLPAELAETPVDYEALRAAGTIMGSGGLVVMDDRDCMVDVARYFLEFTQQESCGHCTFCRVGTRKLLDLLEKICQGKGAPRDLDEIESLSRSITLGSLCGLGKTAPNPVLTTLRYFRDEYEAHLQGRCPAGRCRALIRYEVTADCVGCTLCAQHCPVAAIEPTPYRRHVIDADLCTRCDACRTTCPQDAIRVL